MSDFVPRGCKRCGQASNPPPDMPKKRKGASGPGPVWKRPFRPRSAGADFDRRDCGRRTGSGPGCFRKAGCFWKVGYFWKTGVLLEGRVLLADRGASGRPGAFGGPGCFRKAGCFRRGGGQRKGPGRSPRSPGGVLPGPASFSPGAASQFCPPTIRL